MTTISAEIKNGFLVSVNPVDLPEGTKLTVSAQFISDCDIHGMTEEEQGTSPEAIARWLASFDAIEPLEMSPYEEARWKADREKQRERELNQYGERLERLGRLVE